MRFTRRLAPAVLAAVLACAVSPASAQKNEAPGVTATEIKIGQTEAYSGPASANGQNGIADQAYFKMINDQGGINGRKVNLISLDDAYSPPRTVEQTRKLVEQEGVAFIYRSMGTAPSLAVAKYLNDRKIPQLFIASGASVFNHSDQLPYSMGSSVNYRVEAAIYGRYVLSVKPNAKIAVLYQDDDLGRDFYAGLKDFLGAKAGQTIVKDASLYVTDPTVDSQIVSLQASGADVLMCFATGRPSSLAIRKVYDIGWRPMMIIPSFASSTGSTLKPAGLEKAVGVVTGTYVKDPADPQWQNDPAVTDWNVFMDKYLPTADKSDSLNVFTPTWGAVMAHVLAAAGDDLSRENIMYQATHLQGVTSPLLLPGITFNSTPSDHNALRQLQLQRFDGEKWVRFGDIISGG